MTPLRSPTTSRGRKRVRGNKVYPKKNKENEKKLYLCQTSVLFSISFSFVSIVSVSIRRKYPIQLVGRKSVRWNPKSQIVVSSVSSPYPLRISSVSAPYHLRIISVSPPYHLRIISAYMDTERRWCGHGGDTPPARLICFSLLSPPLPPCPFPLFSSFAVIIMCPFRSPPFLPSFSSPSYLSVFQPFDYFFHFSRKKVPRIFCRISHKLYFCIRFRQRGHVRFDMMVCEMLQAAFVSLYSPPLSQRERVAVNKKGKKTSPIIWSILLKVLTFASAFP